MMEIGVKKREKYSIKQLKSIILSYELFQSSRFQMNSSKYFDFRSIFSWILRPHTGQLAPDLR